MKQIRRCVLVLVGLCLLVAPSLSLTAQTQKRTSHARVSHKTALQRQGKARTKSANVKTGQILALDAKAGTLSLRDAAGDAQTYALLDSMRCFKEKRTVEPTAFATGEMVVVYLRRSRSDGTLQVREMEDAATQEWLDGLRHETTAATVQEIKEDTLTATVGTEQVPFTYTISDKTHWSRAGKEASSTDFKPGDSITIVPRSLPGGGIMARVIADSLTSANQMQERQSLTVHGRIQSIDLATHTLTLATVTGDTRVLQWNSSTELRRGSKTLPLSLLHAGQNVTARLERDTPTTELAWRVTLQTAMGAKRARIKQTVPKTGHRIRKS